MAKLYFRYGAMNCGKSTHLLQVAHNYEERGMNVCLIKPSIDTKGEDRVVSRLGAERVVDVLIAKDDSITQKIAETSYKLSGENYNIFSCILVDEAQFLEPGQVDELYELTKEQEIPVICYGLRTDFTMHGFSGSTRLLEIADDIEEMKTICECGRKATVNARFINGELMFTGDQVLIDNGGGVSYQSMCGKCYILAKKAKKHIK